MNGREKQHPNLSFEIYNNIMMCRFSLTLFHHLHFRVVILFSCWAVRLVGVAWTWLVQTVLWCLIQIGIQPMMIKQWHVCGEMARKRRYIFLLKSMNCIIIAASQLFFMPLEYSHFIYCTIMLFTMQEVWTIGKKLWLRSWVFLYSRMPSWTQFFSLCKQTYSRVVQNYFSQVFSQIPLFNSELLLFFPQVFIYRLLSVRFKLVW